MPNYVYNTVRFAREDAAKVRELVRTDKNAFDFNKIIPMPESLNIVSGSSTYDAQRYVKGEDMGDLRKRYPEEGVEPDCRIFIGTERSPKTMPELRAFAILVEENLEKYGCTDWYDWCSRYWGTKWNACDASWSGNSVWFETAWSDPEPVFLKLSELLGIRFTVECEEESLSFCSITDYENGEKVSEEVADGIEGLKLLGLSRDEIVERYEEWLDDKEMEELNKSLDLLFT